MIYDQPGPGYKIYRLVALTKDGKRVEIDYAHITSYKGLKNKCEQLKDDIFNDSSPYDDVWIEETQ